MMLTSVLDDVI